MSKITFHIKKDGTITADVNGAQGGVCHDMTKPFTDALGSVISTEEKPEVYDQIDDIYVEVTED